MTAGWGTFNVVEGLIDHQLLQIHHVRDDLGGPWTWDVGFLLLGLVLIAGGLALHRQGGGVAAGAESMLLLITPRRIRMRARKRVR